MITEKFKSKSKNRYIVILILVLFSILINGYHFGVSGSHHIIVPFFKSHVDPSLFQNDILFNHLSESYLTYYFKLLSPVAQFIDIGLLFFVLYPVFLYLSFLAVYLISKYLFDNEFAAYLAVLFLIIPNPPLGTTLLGTYVLDARNFAFFLLLFSVYFFLKERYIISFGLTGLAFNFHGMSSTHLLLTYFTYFLLKFNKIKIKKMVQSLAAFLIFAFPLLMWKFSAKTTTLLYVPKLWFELLEIVTSHHLFPLSWGLGKWIPFLTYMLLFGIAMRYKPETEKHDKVITFIKAILIVMAVGFVFIEIIPLSIFLSLQMFRVSTFLMLFALIYISHYLFVLYKEKEESKIAAAGIFTGLLLSNFKIILLFLVFLASIKTKNMKISKMLFSLFIFLTFISIIASFNLIPYLNAFKIGHLSSLVLILIMALFLTFMNFKNNIDQKKQIRLLMILVVFVLFFISISVVSIKYSLHHGFNQNARVMMITERVEEPYDPLSPSRILEVIKKPMMYYKYNIHFPEVPKDERHDIQIWTKNNIPKDAIILAPPYLSDFRLFSERAIVGQFFDGTFLNFDQRWGYVWYGRIKDLCNGFECNSWGCLDYCKDGYNSLSERELKEIAGKYNAQYIVVEKPKSLDLILLYENDKFDIYKI